MDTTSCPARLSTHDNSKRRDFLLGVILLLVSVLIHMILGEKLDPYPRDAGGGREPSV